MMTRVDRKYLLRTAEAQALYGALPPGTRVLDIAGSTQHHYETSYYDTAALNCYFDAVHKRRRRFKIRSRTYCSTGARFLELKTKGPRGVTVKTRTAIDDANTHWSWFDRHRDTTKCTADELRVVLENSYTRMTLSPPDHGRATVDTNLVWRNEHGTISDLDLVIVETKSGASPSQIDRVLWEHGHRPRRLSNFGCGMAALNPSLPANNWHRTLNQYFERNTSNA